MLDYAALSAVAAVIRTGSFERASAELHVTPGAVSQRVRQLERRLGTPLVVRAQPCTATPAGACLVRHADEVGLLEARLAAELGELAPRAAAPRRPTLRVAVNADSLATWFVEVVARVDDVLFDLVVDDQDHSASWLARGEVSAAVTANAVPESGCRVEPLGALGYLATASPAFLDRHCPDGVTAAALARAPMFAFDAKDRLQSRWLLERFGVEPRPPTHRLPSTEAFVRLAAAGAGWGMNPEPLVREALADGRLVELVPDTPLHVPLYWQTPRALDGALGHVTAAVRRAARKGLRDASP